MNGCLNALSLSGCPVICWQLAPGAPCLHQRAVPSQSVQPAKYIPSFPEGNLLCLILQSGSGMTFLDLRWWGIPQLQNYIRGFFSSKWTGRNLRARCCVHLLNADIHLHYYRVTMTTMLGVNDYETFLGGNKFSFSKSCPMFITEAFDNSDMYPWCGIVSIQNVDHSSVRNAPKGDLSRGNPHFNPQQSRRITSLY